MIRLFVGYNQKSAYDMRISDLCSDVCSSDLPELKSPAGSFLGFCKKRHERKPLRWSPALCGQAAMFTYPHVCMWTCSLAYRAFPHLAKPVVERLGHRVLSAHAVLAGSHVHGERHFRAEIARHGLLDLTARRTRVALRSAAGAGARATGDRRGRPPLRLDHLRRWRCIAIPQCEQ